MFDRTTTESKEGVMRTIVCLVVALGALAALAATAGARTASCQTNRTFMQASQRGQLPAVYAAIHGVAVPKALLSCSWHKP